MGIWKIKILKHCCFFALWNKYSLTVDNFWHVQLVDGIEVGIYDTSMFFSVSPLSSLFLANEMQTQQKRILSIVNWIRLILKNTS